MTTQSLSLHQADMISSRALEKADNLGENVVITILNANRRIILTKRMDGCSEFDEEELALAKAYTAMISQDKSSSLQQKWSEEKIKSMMSVSKGKITTVPGG